MTDCLAGLGMLITCVILNISAHSLSLFWVKCCVYVLFLYIFYFKHVTRVKPVQEQTKMKRSE